MNIPLSEPEITESDIQAVVDILRTTRLSMGPALEEFERSIAGYVDAPHAIAVSSGTSALHLCLRAFGVGEGDEVIVPSFAFIATANAIRYQNAKPVFADIEPHTFNLDPAAVENAITPRTRGIIVVHTFGFPAEMTEILAIARRYGLFVIEDACEAIGAEYRGKKCGTLGDAGVFGFYPNKQITTGEGGAIVTRDPGIASLVRGLRNQGRLDAMDRTEHNLLGYNYRISEMNCALGNAQFKRLDLILNRRKTIAKIYSDQLRCNPYVVPPPLTVVHRRISWFVYVVRLHSRFDWTDRNWIVAEMASCGIACGRYFAPVHLQPIYNGGPCHTENLPVTEWVAARSLALPFFNQISNHQIQEVCNTLCRLTDQRARFLQNG